MGKAIRGHPEANPLRSAEAPAPREESLGRYLERQRRLRGLELADVAALTRIPLRSLERLEAGAFDRQNDGFSRGFVRTVASAIGCDPDAAAAHMRGTPPPRVRTGLRLQLVAGGLGLALMSALLAAVTWTWLHTLPHASVPVATNALVRRDAVRTLAVERGLIAAGSDVGQAPLAPLPAPALPSLPTIPLAAEPPPESPARPITAIVIEPPPLPEAIAAEAPASVAEPAAPAAPDAEIRTPPE